MEFEILFQNKKFKIIEFLGNVYINIPKEGIPYVSFNNEEKFYPIRGFFSSNCIVNIIKEDNKINIFFDNEISLKEIADFINILGAKSTSIKAIYDYENDDCPVCLRVMINL